MRPKMARRGFGILAAAAFAGRASAVDDVAGNLLRFNDNGAWSWYQDERAIFDGNQLLIGSDANTAGINGAARSGNVEVSVFDFGTRQSSVQVLGKIQGDDHNSPALLTRPDGRYLALYSNHGSDTLTRYRVSLNPGDATSWQPEQTFNNGIGTTYSNTFYLSAENKTYDFTRTNGFDPNFLVSSDQGSTWSYGGWLAKDAAGSSSTRPYVKYTSNGVDKIFFTITDGHPRDVNNNIYAGYISAGNEYRMDGTLVGPAGTTLATAQSVTNFTPVFTAQPDGVIGNRTHGWTTDMALDAGGNPYTVFTSRVETDTDPATEDTSNHRFYYARWTGTAWSVHELAKAGAGLYSPETDYTGLVALDPNDANTLYMSSAINPVSGASTPHHEIYKGVTADSGATWTWTPITENSTVENLRPIVPKSDGTKSGVFWFRGVYNSYTSYHTSVVGLIDTPGSNPVKPTYVDATTTNTRNADGTLATFSGPAAGQGSSTDHLWARRTSFGNGGEVFTADESAVENAPMLRTTVTGLGAGTYDVWAFLWSNKNEAWQIQAGLDPSTMQLYEKQSAQHVEAGDVTGATVVEDPTGTELLYKVYLGREILTPGEPLTVYIDDGVGAGAARTWYDGVGYAAAPEPSILPLISLAGFALTRRRSGHVAS